MPVLFTTTEDYCLLKVKIAASIAQVQLDIKKVSQEELSKLDSSAKSVVLDTGAGLIGQHVAALRYIGGSSQKALLGVGDIDQAQVDQWLEFSWQELEVPIQTLLALKGDLKAFDLTSADVPEVVKKAKTDIMGNLGVLEDHMSTRTFVVGEKITVADISLFAAFKTVLEFRIMEDITFPSLYRWFMTVGSIPAVSSITGGVGKSWSAQSTSNAPSQVVMPNSKVASIASNKWDRRRIRIKELLKQSTTESIGKEVTLKGWIRTTRVAEKGLILFVELTDGSTVKGIQLVFNSTTSTGMKEVSECGGVGASISVTGIVVASFKGQTIEINVTHGEVLGPVYGGDKGEIGGKNYPMSKKAHSLEFLREKAHLRPRSRVFSSAIRLRHAMAFATHQFFNERGFIYVHTPLITAADCEGAGEQFVVSTLLPEHGKPSDIPVTKKGHIDYSKDFFGRRCCLTVSGQLNVETHACALSDVYTFGPTFRAENSHTSRHLAEFWMIEPEICFATLADDMALAEDYVKYCTAYALEHCADDLYFFEHEYPAGEKGLSDRLRNVLEHDFAQITYTDAVALLQSEIAAGKVQFEAYPNWGDDLGSEHERYITEKIYKRPTIVSNYPKGIKAFYMKLNDDNETVAAMDILVPKIGELIGGSQREDNLQILEKRVVEMGMKVEDIWWYADLRRYGTVPHAGFGLGFERLIMFVTGLENIRDVIPFPRVPGHAEF